MRYRRATDEMAKKTGKMENLSFPPIFLPSRRDIMNKNAHITNTKSCFSTINSRQAR
jgi:hypothetical protein